MKRFVMMMLLVSSPVFAGVGTITQQEGQSNIQRQKNTLPGTKGASVEMLDVIVTGKGKTGITFVDDTKVNVTENSKLVIDDFVYDPKSKGTGKLAMKVAMGTVRYASGAVAHENPNSVKINTPTATIAVRGTDFVMSVDEVGRSIVVLMPQCDDTKVQIEMTCKSGEIEVITPAGSVVMNKPYQATVVESRGNAPPTPSIIKFDSRQVGNNMQVSSPKTEGGASLVEKAREAVKEANKSAADKQAEKNNNPTSGIAGVTAEQAAQIAQQNAAQTTQETKADDKPVQKSMAELLAQGTRVTPIYDNKQLQIGWKYYGVSDSKGQETNLVLPKDSLAQIVVVQDMIIDVFQFANKPGGYITIRQNQK